MRISERVAGWVPRGGQARLRVASLIAAMIFVGLMVVELMPSTAGHNPASTHGVGMSMGEIGAGDQEMAGWLDAVQGRQLFKPATPLPARAMARDSVNRVRSLLSLHGIMQRDGVWVAYIRIKGMGMKAYKQGDLEENVFKVTRIHQRAVELEIVGERVELQL